MTVDEIDVVVVGAGQAGLATSHELAALGVAHEVFERADAIGASWAGRWDSFCLVTPNHGISLPGGEYRGDDPNGYLSRDDIEAHLSEYATSLDAPVRTGVEVASLTSRPDGRLSLRTTADRDVVARHVVVASGGLRTAYHPAWAAEAGVPVVDASQYRNPESLPPGAVLVVGSGQTGCQLAEELLTSGRRVVQACGRAPWMPRRIGGRDTFDCLADTGFMDQRLDDIPAGPAARFMANPQATGRDGGHDLTTRTLQALGVELAGHVAGIDGNSVVFADDLADSVAFGDARWGDLCGAIRRWCGSVGRPVPELPDAAPFDASQELHRMTLTGIGSILLTTGFRPSYRAWIDVPGAFDAMGFPVQVDGLSSVTPGLSFVGVPFMCRRSSQLLMGVGRDATLVARGVRQRVAA